MTNPHTDLVLTIDSTGNLSSSSMYRPYGELQSSTGTLTANLSFQSDYKDPDTGGYKIERFAVKKRLYTEVIKHREKQIKDARELWTRDEENLEANQAYENLREYLWKENVKDSVELSEELWKILPSSYK